MYTEKRLDIIHERERIAWLGNVRDARVSGSLSKWKAIFGDGTAWMVRFSIVGNVCDELADEKVAMEVQVLNLIRQHTNIPVPRVKAWGRAVDNTLGLGPFIIMDLIEGVSVSTLFRASKNERLLKEDINDHNIESIYKQYARILMQLFKLDFERIGSFPSPVTRFQAPIRPLTFKVHDILQTGGVNTFGLEQLLRQPNKTTGFNGAKDSYRSFSVLKSLVPQFVKQDYRDGPAKLICDDLGLTNLIVKSKDDLTVVGVVDLEWSYVGPAQLFGSAPWWLLLDRLNNYDTFNNEEDIQKILSRYLRHLEIFQHILQEEETREGKKSRAGENEFSDLMKWSVDSGAMWLHMVPSWGFNDPKVLPFAQLIKHIGFEKWEQLKKTIPDTKELQEFARNKVSQLEQYDMDVEAMQADGENWVIQ
ncbi:hypothetical protein GQ44DRAFT_819114 [Phaeosphaeriaceae sp. PMI808]|nr:hypothetical protein GQ44DRAFT_819114 [Phaeosphaeriaceae sp. PMI808]